MTVIIDIRRSLRKSKRYPDFVLEGLSSPESEKVNPDLIVELVKYICTDPSPGAILIFVPGWEDINSISRRFNENDYFSSCEYKI